MQEVQDVNKVARPRICMNANDNNVDFSIDKLITIGRYYRTKRDIDLCNTFEKLLQKLEKFNF